jgi:hypothetical protein
MESNAALTARAMIGFPTVVPLDIVNLFNTDAIPIALM